MDRNEVFNIDCMEYMRSIPDKAFSLAIADPPYGLPAASTQGAGKLRNRQLNMGNVRQWDVAPPQEFFDELFRVSRHQIIWGGNYFPLPPTRCIIAWDKCQPWPNFSQVEIAWTSFDCPAKLFKYDNRTGDKIHPTQKPVALYSWIIKNFYKNGGGIFDPMMGSQSSRIAAYRMGIDYCGCELSPEYFAKGCERFDSECRGIIHLSNGKTIHHPTLF